MRIGWLQVEELRQQVRVLQAVGYNALEADDGQTGTDGASSRSPAAKAGQPGSLEALLLDKNRHMEHELTMARLKVADFTGALSARTLLLEISLDMHHPENLQDSKNPWQTLPAFHACCRFARFCMLHGCTDLLPMGQTHV